MAERSNEEQMARRMNELAEQKEIIEGFKTLDKDGTGLISAAGIRDLFSERLAEEEINQMMRIADIDGDGKIDYGQLVKVMKNK